MRVTIEVFSDVICPWCYIGERRLEMALDLLDTEDDVEVLWQPFQLNPGMPFEGIERQKYRSAKFGGLERSLELDARVTAVGAGVGISFAVESGVEQYWNDRYNQALQARGPVPEGPEPYVILTRQLERAGMNLMLCLTDQGSANVNWANRRRHQELRRRARPGDRDAEVQLLGEFACIGLK
jgi:DSBA-like thioredoxin domain